MIVTALAHRLNVRAWTSTLEGSADALDAVVCVFAAVAVGASKVSTPNSATVSTEGWVAVHP